MFLTNIFREVINETYKYKLKISENTNLKKYICWSH